MRFNEFQRRILASAPETESLATLLALGAHAGALLQAHRRYLEDGIDALVSETLVSRELGAVLRHIAVLAGAYGLQLDDVARGNIAKIRRRPYAREAAEAFDIPNGPLSADAYQNLAAFSDEQAGAGVDPLALAVPMLGLAGEIGTLLVAQKKEYRDKASESKNQSFVSTELGDALWYASTVARHARLRLSELLHASASQAELQQHEFLLLETLPEDLPVLDVNFPYEERFPRQLVFRFQERRVAGLVSAVMTLIEARPNHFPGGPISYGAKEQGFSIGESIGNQLTDNSRRIDNYRYHDAIHLGFLAVMGWSPNMRSLLKLKRRSDPAVDENEDGARAIFAEEGMAAVLAKRAGQLQEFQNERAVDDDTLDMIATVFEDLEVSQMPCWLWRRAISQGFRAMRALSRGPGGFLLVDLDRRTLSYHKTPPTLRGSI